MRATLLLLSSLLAVQAFGEWSPRGEVVQPAQAEGSRPSRCRLSGGGCLNEEGDSTSHRQHTFGGSVGFEDDIEATAEHVWQSVYRDGRRLLLDFKSEDARLVRCRPAATMRCPAPVGNVLVDIEGTGTARLETGMRIDANFLARVVDHREGACGSDRDLYSITVRSGHSIGRGDVLLRAEGEIDCGNLQISGFEPGPP